MSGVCEHSVDSVCCEKNNHSTLFTLYYVLNHIGIACTLHTYHSQIYIFNQCR